MIRARNLLWIIVPCLLLLAACGHSRRLVISTPSGLDEASTASTADPQWLTDALAHLPEPYGRAGFFYDVVHPPYTDPLISVFPERAETHNQISVSLGPTGNYASVPGDTGDFFSFRVYLAQGISQGDFPFNAFIYCYALQGHTPITAYCNELPQDLSDY